MMGCRRSTRIVGGVSGRNKLGNPWYKR